MSDTSKRVWRSCPACGTKESAARFTKSSLSIVRCSRCSMLFANPVDAELAEGTFYDRLATPFYLSPDKLDSDYAPIRFNRELRIFRQYCRQGAVLDIGCSTGAFLHQLQRRFPNQYTVLGTDVSCPALDYAERQGVPALREKFLDHNFGSQRFDAITFWAVIEHLVNPARFVQKAASLLAPGGHCFVLVPNMNSLAVRLLGTRYRYIMDEHLNYFTVQTLQRFIQRLPNLSIVALKSTHFNPVVIWQDWKRGGPRVPDAERAQLLKRTTGWKQKPLLIPAKWIYNVAEEVLGHFRLADNLVIVLQRR